MSLLLLDLIFRRRKDSFVVDDNVITKTRFPPPNMVQRPLSNVTYLIDESGASDIYNDRVEKVFPCITKVVPKYVRYSNSYIMMGLNRSGTIQGLDAYFKEDADVVKDFTYDKEGTLLHIDSEGRLYRYHKRILKDKRFKAVGGIDQFYFVDMKNEVWTGTDTRRLKKVFKIPYRNFYTYYTKEKFVIKKQLDHLANFN